jgi:hypothetical protein
LADRQSDPRPLLDGSSENLKRLIEIVARVKQDAPPRYNGPRRAFTPSIMLLGFKRQISMQNTPSEIADLEQSQTSKYHKQDRGDPLATRNTKRNGDGTDQ